MLQKDSRLTLQLDVTATPRHNNSAIFVQTVSDYPLVEAIHQNVVKHPVLADTAGAVWIVETKGREELDLSQKMARLRQWCADATAASAGEGRPRYGFVYVDQEGFEQHAPLSFAGLVTSFREYREMP